MHVHARVRVFALGGGGCAGRADGHAERTQNANAPNLMKKYEQLVGLGFTNVFIYPGGLFDENIGLKILFAELPDVSIFDAQNV